MRRICLIVEYDGTDFAGWQTQQNANSVQQEIEKNLLKITGERIIIHGSGRTDSGVHALAQAAHFDTTARMPAEKFALALNAGLPFSIRVHQSFEVSSEFHARFSAKRKHYRYTIENQPIPSAIGRHYRHHVYGHLDVSAMQEAAKKFCGTHNFASFTSMKCPLSNTVRTMYHSELVQQGHLLAFDVIGSGFLYHMVRIMIGTLLEIGRGRHAPSYIDYLLEHPEKAFHAGDTAPAHGLTLIGVDYPNMKIEQTNPHPTLDFRSTI